MLMLERCLYSPSSAASVLNAADSNSENLKREPTFIHVPKNGGTAIKGAAKTLEYNSNLVGMSRDAHACTWYHMPPQWMPNYGGYPLSNNKTTNTFVLARNPFHRAISQFRWSCWATPHIYPIAGDAVADKNPNKEILPGTPGYTGNSWVEFDPNLFVFKQPHGNKRRPRFPELNLNESIGCSNRRVTECAKPMQRLLSWHSSACQKNATLLNMYLEYVTNSPHPPTSFFVNSITLMGCTTSVSSRVGSKLPLPLYADVRFHIPMTHRNDAGTQSQDSPNQISFRRILVNILPLNIQAMPFQNANTTKMQK